MIPRWLVILGSLVIAFHFGSVVIAALAAPSGPWPVMEGSDLVRPPQFAVAINDLTGVGYLKYIRMTHAYHFASNRPGTPAVYLEAHLKNAAGEEVGTLKFPEDDVNPWVRHRQEVLVQGLGGDQPVPPPQSEVIAAAGHKVPEVLMWDAVDNQGNTLTLKKVPMHLVPRDRPIMRPSEWSLVLADSYRRYLCRTYGAASVEIIRHHKDPIPPAVLFEENIPPGAFSEGISHFVELPK
jgi:hypothetical protein